MFENVGWGEILVLVLAGLFILGPERLPEAAAWLGKTIRQVKDFASGARDQLRSELGPDFEDLRKPFDDLRAPLRELRDLDPRRALGRSLFDDPPATKPNGWAPGAGGSPAGTTAAGAAISAAAANGPIGPGPGMNGTGSAAHPVRPLSPDERPPIDPDAT